MTLLRFIRRLLGLGFNPNMPATWTPSPAMLRQARAHLNQIR